MTEQTENYIMLKPISERFNKISSEITDSEIKNTITNVIKEKIEQLTFEHEINDIITNYLEENKDEVINIFRKSLIDKFSNK